MTRKKYDQVYNKKRECRHTFDFLNIPVWANFAKKLAAFFF